MMQEYLKMTFRYLARNKAYGVINISGLAIGMAVSLLIGLWIRDELSFDSYCTHRDRLAQVMLTGDVNGYARTYQYVARPLADVLRTGYKDDFKYVALTSDEDDHVLSIGGKQIVRSGMWVQPDFPVMFSFKMMSGDLHGLQDPSSVLVSRSLAEALFGHEDPIGKSVRVDSAIEVRVAGVYEDPPANTTFRDVKFVLPFDKWVSIDEKIKDAEHRWGYENFLLFVELYDPARIDALSAKIRDVPLAYRKTPVSLQLHAMQKWHLYSEFVDGKVVGGRIRFVRLFGLIGGLVLLLACINFMNLSTASNEKRAKEIGVRKSIGSTRGQLIRRFMIESLIMSALALLLSLLLALLALPFFNQLADKQIVFPWNQIVFWLSAVVLMSFSGIIAGIYPAVYLSGFHPVDVLKGTIRNGASGTIARKILVVVQFTISLSLGLGTIIVFKQIEYAQQRPMGYAPSGLITLHTDMPDGWAHFGAMKAELLQSRVVEEVAASHSPVTEIDANYIGFDWTGKAPGTEPWFGVVKVTPEFGRTVGWDIREGRDFSDEYARDSLSIVLNQAAVGLMGFKKPVGQTVDFDDKPYKVIGVVRNLVMESPYKPIKPTVFFMEQEEPGTTLTVRIKPSVGINNALGKIERVIRKYDPGEPFQYSFVDDEYRRKFDDERRIGRLAYLFTFLAVFISCLGMFGLASFLVERRTKEIGVRKVLGASVLSLWRLLTTEYLALVLLACMVAMPLAAWIMNGWLQQYQYRTGLSASVFIAAGGGAIVICLVTISYQVIKACLINPVKTLRSY